MGKVLIIDKILNVARYGGEQRFIDRQGVGDALCALHGPGAGARHGAHRRGGVQYRLLSGSGQTIAAQVCGPAPLCFLAAGRREIAINRKAMNSRR
jgi:hypothetical protein